MVSEDVERGLDGIDRVEILTPNERKRINRQFIREMYEQIYAKRLTDIELYNSWMNVLEQGASIEGVYRGLTLSEQYRELERGVVSKEAKEFFAQEITYLEMLKNPKVRNEAEMIREISKNVEKAPLFTLKRILGERVLEAIDLRKTDREAVATLFADLTARWSKVDVDFGFKQRNNKDRDYHYAWALRSSRGRVQWEILNRVHRIMNHFGKIAYIR